MLIAPPTQQDYGVPAMGHRVESVATGETGDAELSPPDSGQRVPVQGDESHSDETVDLVQSPESLRKALEQEVLGALPEGWHTPIPEGAISEGPMLGTTPHGEWVLVYPETGWTDRGHFVLGARQGEWQLFDGQGELIRVRTFVNGKIDGEMRDRLDASSSWRTYTYRHGELVQ